MVAHERRASQVFVKDVEDTFALLQERVKITREEEEREGAREHIQLVPENPSQTISFNVPDGPPPENLVPEGPDAENLDIEEVRKALQMRWDVFQGFSEPFKDALRKGTLEGVNKVLGEMKVEEAEEVVSLLDVGGIMSFAEGGIRDERGTSKTEEKNGGGDDDAAKSKGKAKA
jgi:cell division cycle protein 37